MAVILEERPYGPDSTAEEIKAIRECICLYNDGIVMYKEVPVQSVFQLDLFMEKIREITTDLASFDMLIDLTEANRPSPEIRTHLKKCFNELEKLRHVAVFTGQNFMLNIAAKFVLSSCGIRSYSVHKKLEEALEAIYVQK
jgi:hypothetical protein